MDLAEHISWWSKDPSTKVGAVIVDANRRIIGVGYNGFPRGVKDTSSRYHDKAEKYPRVVHAEVNAILNSRGSVNGASIYIHPLFTCCECAKIIIQSGIVRVVAYAPDEERHDNHYDIARQMYDEAGVEVLTR
jgi:dCMP deaminase